MARPLRIEIPDGVYHVTARGNGKQTIFRDAADRLEFLRIFERVLSRFAWRCLTWCLMNNHYHLLVTTPIPNLARGMQQLNSQFAQWFNRRDECPRHLFQGRYGSPLAERDSHLLSIARYIALNPVKDGFCRAPEDWLWSGHRAIVGLSATDFTAASELLSYFGEHPEIARRRYLDFVHDGSSDELATGKAVVGSPEFVQMSLELATPSPEHPRRQWQAGRPALAAVLSDPDRDRAIAAAYRDYGYRMSEIAAELRCHYATVSRRLAAHERRSS